MNRPADQGAVRGRLGRDDWIAAARTALITGGVHAIKIGRLAKTLKTSRGGFYWHFKSRGDLLETLLETWEATNTVPFERVLTNAIEHDGVQEFLAFTNLWLEERNYSPAFDTAVRDWARSAPQVVAIVKRVDERRVSILHRVFKDLGFVDPEALVRARITYFHQMGYYALAITEPREQRIELIPIYARILMGRALDPPK